MTSPIWHHPLLLARVAKLADALDLGSCALTGVGVQLPPLAFLTSEFPYFLSEESNRFLPSVPAAV